MVEPFQARFAADVFSGVPEAWLVLPEGNAKTTLVAGFALYHLQFRREASIPAAASSRDQAEWLYRAAAGFVERSELDDLFKCQEGYRRIRCDSMGSRLQIFAADSRTGDGVIPTLCLVDELHRHRNLDLYRTWRGKLLKRNGQIVAISTAGAPGDDFEETRERVRAEASSVETRGAFSRIVGSGIVVHEYAVPVRDSTDDMRKVKKANPLKAIRMSDLRAKRASPTMTEAHWLRYVCGRPSVDGSWLEEAEWDALGVDIGGVEFGERVWVSVVCGQNPAIAVAAARPDDITLIEDEDETVAVLGAAVKVSIFDGRVGYQRLERELAGLHLTYDLAGVLYDAAEFGRSAELLEARGLPMVEFPHSVERLARATSTLQRVVQAQILRHDGDQMLRAQMLRSVIKENTRTRALVKSDGTRGVVALAVAVHQATTMPVKVRSPRIHVLKEA